MNNTANTAAVTSTSWLSSFGVDKSLHAEVIRDGEAMGFSACVLRVAVEMGDYSLAAWVD